MSTPAHVVIAAAGLGSRLGRGHPKCLVEFRGRTLLERQLDLLQDVDDVRIVVGFQAEEVVSHARSIRSDITFVRNPAYASTSTLASYEIGARYLTEPCIFMDADIVFAPESFATFLQRSREETNLPLIAYTDTKTVDAVYVDVVDGLARAFSRTRPAPYEWANLACLPPRYCEGTADSVFAHLERDLPLTAHHVVCHEIDRPADFDAALAYSPLMHAIELQDAAADASVASFGRRIASRA